MEFYSGYECTWWGINDVELAMRVPKEYLQAYKGAKITKINFYANSITTYGVDDVEYVFVARRGTNEYLAKVPASVVPGTWMEIPLPEPLLIDGEELMVGIGNHGHLSASWASSDICADGMWMRQMGVDWGGICSRKMGAKCWKCGVEPSSSDYFYHRGRKLAAGYCYIENAGGKKSRGSGEKQSYGKDGRKGKKHGSKGRRGSVLWSL